jgi:hypothetical protein
MDQHDQLLPAEAELFECSGIQNFFDFLQLSEVVAIANGSERPIEFGRVELEFSQNFADIAFPRMVQIKANFRPPVEFHVELNQIGFEQRHSATDVTANEMRVNDSLSYERRAHRDAFTRMQIRETDRQTHTLEPGSRIELAQRLIGRPRIRRGDKANLSFIQSIHVSFLARQSGMVWFCGALGFEFRIPHVNGPQGWYRANVSSSSERR